MIISEYILRFVMGGGLLTLITILAKSKNPTLAGIFVLFPAVTLVGYWFIAKTVDASQLQGIALHSIYALPTTLVFLIAFYLSCGRFSIGITLLISVIAWLACAGLLVIATKSGVIS